MVFRYWGDAHASMRQFEPLVDRKAGGISEAVLAAAIAERNWNAQRVAGSFEALRAELQARRPPIILIEDRPRRYHYVVVVGMSDSELLVHDPTWGPARRVSATDLERAWTATAHWMLRVTPGTVRPQDSSDPPAASATVTNPATAPSVCDIELDRALDAIAAQGLTHADDALTAVAKMCPEDSRPWSELAAVRFAAKRWSEAAALANDALSRDRTNKYAAEVLASSLFMMNDVGGALRAWNLEGRPQLDSVRITGLTRTRYALLAEALGLEADTTLTADDFLLARRRLESMPDFSSSRLSLRPGDDGFAVVDAAVVERPTLPKHGAQWAAVAARTAIDREVTLRVPGRTGQGEAWAASWRWWANRPAASIQFAAPRIDAPRGVWRGGLSWDAQTYGSGEPAGVREGRLRGDVGLATWLTAGLQLSVTLGVDRWQLMSGEVTKTMSVGGAIERRAFADRFSATVAASRWIGADSSPFSRLEARVAFVSRTAPAPLVLLASGGASIASTGSPLALWSGAGEGRARDALLRAHPLLDDGRVVGPVFGRHLLHATTEAQHWFRSSLVRVGAAAFLDAASASERLNASVGRAFQLDAGAGLRLRLPGAMNTLRVDYAHGLRDGADAWTIGWQID